MTMPMLVGRYLSRSILHTLHPTLVTRAGVSSSFTLTSIILSPLYSTHAETQHSENAMTEFLRSECGLRQSEVTIVMKRRPSLVTTRSIQTAMGAVEYLRDFGFSQTQIRHIIVKNPSFIGYKAGQQMKLKIEFIKTLGISAQELPDVIWRAPRMLGYNLDNLSARISSFVKIFGSRDNLLRCIKKRPVLLLCDEDKLSQSVDILDQVGVKGELLSLLMSRRPDILSSLSIERLKLKIEYIKNMGFEESSKAFVCALWAVATRTPENLESKFQYISSLGLLEEDVHKIVKKNPNLLRISTKKMQQNVGFLVGTAGLQPKTVVTNSKLLHYSIEKRLKPRYEVFKSLGKMENTERLPSLLTMLLVKEQEFIEKIMKCSSQAAKLYEVLKGKPALSTVP